MWTKGSGPRSWRAARRQWRWNSQNTETAKNVEQRADVCGRIPMQNRTDAGVRKRRERRRKKIECWQLDDRIPFHHAHMRLSANYRLPGLCVGVASLLQQLHTIWPNATPNHQTDFTIVRTYHTDPISQAWSVFSFFQLYIWKIKIYLNMTSNVGYYYLMSFPSLNIIKCFPNIINKYIWVTQVDI